MRSTRQFLIAPSFARLIRRERGAARITEGHFPTEGGRSPHVEIDGEQANLILMTLTPGQPPQEERTVVPRAHGEALLDVSPGKVQYARSRIAIGADEARIDRFVTPGALDLVSVEFENTDEAGRFRAPPWFGPEVTGETAYQNRTIAFEGVPEIPEIDLTDASLSSLLDALEGTTRSSRVSSGRSRSSDERNGSAARLAALYGGAERPAAPRAANGSPPPAVIGPPAPATPETPAPEPEAAEAKKDEKVSTPELDYEDDVIRELAYSLRPTGR